MHLSSWTSTGKQTIISLSLFHTNLCRKDEKNYDIEELYQFADQTGILERHKQLLAQPFHEDQVT